MKYLYPCSYCLVTACCTTYCIEHFKYINKITIDFPDKMTVEEIDQYYDTTPMEAKKVIDVFRKECKIYSFPDNYESSIPRFVPTKIMRGGI